MQLTHTGKINRIINRTYGFVRKRGDSDDLFLHYSECPGRVLPPEGTIIEFTLGTFRERPVVRDVAIVAIPETASATTEAVSNAN
jgi:cold shock CspA family protein